MAKVLSQTEIDEVLKRYPNTVPSMKVNYESLLKIYQNALNSAKKKKDSWDIANIEKYQKLIDEIKASQGINTSSQPTVQPIRESSKPITQPSRQDNTAVTSTNWASASDKQIEEIEKLLNEAICDQDTVRIAYWQMILGKISLAKETIGTAKNNRL